MNRRSVLLLCLSFVITADGIRDPLSAQARQPAQAATTTDVPRAIRRDVPMTNSIRQAFEARTRDATGRPGPNYWQLQTDFAITATLDPATHTITGSETITIHNNSPEALTELVLRLDHNIFRPRAYLASPWLPAPPTRLVYAAVFVTTGPSSPRRAA